VLLQCQRNIHQQGFDFIERGAALEVDAGLLQSQQQSLAHVLGARLACRLS
jgi:hypothetical protein